MAAKSQGCKLHWSTDSGVTYTQVTGLTTVTFPEVTKNRIECTDLDDTSKQYLSGLPDSGSASYSGNYDGTNTSHQAMHVLESSSDVVQWLVEIQEEGVATMTTAVYQGYVDHFTPSGSVDAIQDAELVVQPTGGNTYAHAATAK